MSTISNKAFILDPSLSVFFKDYKYLDEIYLVTDFLGNVLASDREYFTIEFYGKFSTKNLNIFDIIDKEYHKVILKRMTDIKSGQIVSPIEYKLSPVKGQSAYIEVFTILSEYRGRQAIISKVRDITLKKEVEKKLLYAVVQTEEKERRRFAQDLHDELGPFLAGLKLYLHELNRTDLEKSHKKRLLEYLSQMTNEAVEKIRSISSNLMPQNLIEAGLGVTIEKVIDSLNQAGKLSISFSTTGNETGLANSLEITIYRIILELINNTIKHSGAKKVIIELNFSSDMVIMMYKDDGMGFDLQNKIRINSGIGLKSIMDRIELFHGSYEFDSKNEMGIKFTITFPLK